jgi:uncharacterized repeat protein (TIGR03803 family)
VLADEDDCGYASPSQVAWQQKSVALGSRTSSAGCCRRTITTYRQNRRQAVNTRAWLSKLFNSHLPSKRKPTRRTRGIVLQLDVLEARCVPALTTLSTLAAFQGANGIGPMGGLVADSAGNLFGTAVAGGSGNSGTVFEVPKGSSTITTLATFNGTNGSKPQAGVMVDSSGNLFGTTSAGGPSNNGTIFEVKKGSSTITTLATFNGTNGANSATGLVMDSGGNLFGLTAYGGTGYSGSNSSGYGTVFELASGSGTITSLAKFNGTNGAGPTGHLAIDASGNLFGATDEGGPAGDGTVFEVVKGSGSITTLASFNTTNGAYTVSGVVLDSAGNLFGTTMQGGGYGNGTVFEEQKGSGTITTLATFAGSNGAAPASSSGVWVDSNGNVFGTASDGGQFNDGTVFEVPKGSNTINTLAIFDGTNGADPQGSVIADSNGNLFGTTFGAGASNGGTVFTVTGSAPTVTITTTTLPNWTLNEAGYSQAITVAGGTKPYKWQTTAGNLPTGLTLSSTGVISGTPTAQGTYAFTVTATDANGAWASQVYYVSVSPGPFSKYLVTVLGPSTIQAGSAFQATVQGVDAYGNLPANYTGPATVTANSSPGSAASNLPITVSLNSAGFGFFLGTLQKAGSYTISVSGGGFSGSAATPLTVTSGPADKLGFSAQPVNTPTGVTLLPVAVQVQDFYGNVVTSDNTDTVTLSIASGPGSFTAGSTAAASVHNGVVTFSNLTLVQPGQYTLSALVHGQFTGPDSASFSVLPLQVVPGSFVATPSGFSLSFNAPILLNPSTPVLYGTGFGSSASVPSVTLTQTLDASGHAVNNPITGSLVLNAAGNALTFVATNTALEANNGWPLLPDGTYTAVLHGSATGSGFQALNSDGGFLDGLGNGTPGSSDYTSTFVINAAAAHDDALWVPDVAEGPGQTLNAPGANKTGGGYPIYLNDSSGLVTTVLVTLNYNPALLNVTGVTGTGFTLLKSSTPGQAVLQYTGPALPTGSQVPIGFLTASVPAGTTVSPTPYRAEDLLHLSGPTLNGGAVSVATGDGLHVVAYVGDADASGSYSGNDAVLITRVALQTDTGFAAYPLVDPIIVADTDGAGFIPSDAALQVNEAGVGVPTANLANPPLPAGVHFQAMLAHPDRSPEQTVRMLQQRLKPAVDADNKVDLFSLFPDPLRKARAL